MKARMFIIALVTLCCRLSALGAEDYVRESGWAGETFSSKVIKDLSVRDEGADYVAYLVHWKDHEVVVTATGPLEKRYAVGDSIRCTMMRQDFPHGGEMKSMLVFTIAGNFPGSDPVRLKAIADEVAARRAQREKTLSELPPPVKP